MDESEKGSSPGHLRLLDQNITHQLLPNNGPRARLLLLQILLHLGIQLLVIVIRVDVVSYADEFFVSIRGRNDDDRHAEDFV